MFFTLLGDARLSERAMLVESKEIASQWLDYSLKTEKNMWCRRHSRFFFLFCSLRAQLDLYYRTYTHILSQGIEKKSRGIYIRSHSFMQKKLLKLNGFTFFSWSGSMARHSSAVMSIARGRSGSTITVSPTWAVSIMDSPRSVASLWMMR